ncbi:hypothetical protein DFH07DRAFT_784855 [Mycena maculata]|uniref:Uncharacterized protein n=1 Tax=Mycena maculata TaxID=230809 RepID=A0AAD7MI59_9AGAR|nr:hypothetical protein DFH07DRAFT_784855 [Mycena maculata]
MRRLLVTLPCAPSPAGQVNRSIKLSTHYRPSSGSTPALRTFQDHGSPSAMCSASLSQDKCGLPVTQIPEREPPSRTAICALDEVLPNLRSAHVKVVGLLFNEASDGITIGFPFKSCQYSPHLSPSIERAAKPLKTPVGSVSEVLRTFATKKTTSLINLALRRPTLPGVVYWCYVELLYLY